MTDNQVPTNKSSMIMEQLKVPYCLKRNTQNNKLSKPVQFQRALLCSTKNTRTTIIEQFTNNKILRTVHATRLDRFQDRGARKKPDMADLKPLGSCFVHRLRAMRCKEPQITAIYHPIPD